MLKYALFSALTVTASCASTPTPTPAEPKDILLSDTEEMVYRPILLTRSEFNGLGEVSKDMIIDHNNIYYCRNADARPEGFDVEVCQT